MMISEFLDSSWTLFALKGADAEHLDTRRFQIEEICRGLQVFPQIVGCGMIRRFWIEYVARISYAAVSELCLLPRRRDTESQILGLRASERTPRGNRVTKFAPPRTR